jgi:hypothetical protein
MIDYWGRLLELERRVLRLQSRTFQLEQKRAELQQKINIISSGSFARSSDQLNGLVSWANTLEMRLVQVLLPDTTLYTDPENSQIAQLEHIGYPPRDIFYMFALTSQDKLFSWHTLNKDVNTYQSTVNGIGYTFQPYTLNESFNDGYLGSSLLQIEIAFGSSANATDRRIQLAKKSILTFDNPTNGVQMLNGDSFTQIGFASGGPQAGTTGTMTIEVPAKAFGRSFGGIYYTDNAGTATLEIRWS